MQIHKDDVAIINKEWNIFSDQQGVALRDCQDNAYERGYNRGRSEFAELERSYTQRLGEMARLCDIVCQCLLGWEGTDLFSESGEEMAAAKAIMEYVEAVRPPEGSKPPDWVVHILGPDDVIPCVSQFDALRKADRHNKQMAKLLANDPSPNSPYTVAVVDNRADWEVQP